MVYIYGQDFSGCERQVARLMKQISGTEENFRWANFSFVFFGFIVLVSNIIVNIIKTLDSYFENFAHISWIDVIKMVGLFSSSESIAAIVPFWTPTSILIRITVQIRLEIEGGDLCAEKEGLLIQIWIEYGFKNHEICVFKNA